MHIQADVYQTHFMSGCGDDALCQFTCTSHANVKPQTKICNFYSVYGKHTYCLMSWHMLALFYNI